MAVYIGWICLLALALPCALAEIKLEIKPDADKVCPCCISMAPIGLPVALLKSCEAPTSEGGACFVAELLGHTAE